MGWVVVEIGGVLTPGSYPTDPTGLPTRRLSLRRLRWQAAVAVPAVLAGTVALGGVVAAFWFLGGSGWPVLIPALVWGGLAVAWVRQIREVAQSGQGPLTPVWAALPDRHVWPGDLVTGWLVVEPGWPGRFGIERCPPELAAELIEHRRLWVFGAPRMGDVLVGLPGQDGYAKAWLSPAGRAPEPRRRGVRRRGRSWVIQRHPSSSSPPGIGAAGSYGVRLKMNVARLRWFAVPFASRPTVSVSPA